MSFQLSCFWGRLYGQLGDIWGFEIFVGKETHKYKLLTLIQIFEEMTGMSLPGV